MVKKLRNIPPSARQVSQPIERSLQDVSGGHLVDDLGAPCAGDVVFDQRPRDDGGRETLVPIGDGQIGSRPKVAGECARRLRARAIASLEIERQSENDAGDLELGENGDQRGGVLLERSARQGFERRSNPTLDVGEREPDCLGSEIDADQAGLGRQALCEVNDLNRTVHDAAAASMRRDLSRTEPPRRFDLRLHGKTRRCIGARLLFPWPFEESSMSVDLAAVRRIAHLARIGVSEAETPHLQHEINAILKFVEALEAVDVEGVEPMTSVIPMRLPMRDDIVTDGGIVDKVLANAPLTEVTSLTLAEARDQLKSRAISSLEITRAHLAAIERAKALNAFVATTAEKALAMAASSDARLAEGEGGPLEGLPIGVKDLYATEGVHTQACSHILEGFRPTYESTVTANLWRDGAVMLGKLNMDEFAMGSSNETSYYGPVASPWLPPNWSHDQARAALANGKRGLLTPGGSSGGSSAAVAARL